MTASAKSLAGKVALVTGAGKRIGREIALTLAGAGADVAITYRTSVSESASTCAELCALGVRGLAVKCDVRDEASVQRTVAQVLAEFGGLDVLVNNAGAFASVPLEKITLAQWDEMAEINTRGPFLMARAAYPALKLRRGRIINIGSLGGSHAWATHAHYCASKAGLHMLSQTMAKAWAPEISVNCVAPGMIAFDGEPGMAAKTPMQRDGTAADVAEAVLFFATGPQFITGQLLAVDGGLGL